MQNFIRRSQLLAYGWWLLLPRRWDVWQMEWSLARQRGRFRLESARLEKAWKNWEYMRTPAKRERVRQDLRTLEMKMAALAQKINNHETLLVIYHRTIREIWQKIREMV
ncbi:MAG: hypothetical protein AAB647_03635 [Patescibacteria group bacterium]